MCATLDLDGFGPIAVSYDRKCPERTGGFSPMHSDVLVNVCFHGIGVPDRDLEVGERAYWITPDVFESIVDYAVGRPIAISFDDGNSSDVEIALPRLVERGLTASFFPIALNIGKPGSIDTDGLHALRSHGMTIGSHGMRHRSWRGLTEEVLNEEFVLARSVIEHEAETRVDVAACPFGTYDRRTLARLRRLKYRHVYTSDRALARADAWLQPRYSIRAGGTVDNVRTIVEHGPTRLGRAVSAGRITLKRWR